MGAINTGVKWDASSRWSFELNSACGSKELITIGKMQPTLFFQKFLFSMINPEAIMRRLSSSPTRTSTPQISNFATPKRTPIRPQGMSLSQGHPSCSRVASLPNTPQENIQRTPLPFPTFRDDPSNQNSNSNIRKGDYFLKLFHKEFNRPKS